MLWKLATLKCINANTCSNKGKFPCEIASQKPMVHGFETVVIWSRNNRFVLNLENAIVFACFSGKINSKIIKPNTVLEQWFISLAENKEKSMVIDFTTEFVVFPYNNFLIHAAKYIGTKKSDSDERKSKLTLVGTSVSLHVLLKQVGNPLMHDLTTTL